MLIDMQPLEHGKYYLIHYEYGQINFISEYKHADQDEIRIELAALLRDMETVVQHSLSVADAIMERFELRKK